jgi:hypothetical protein
MTNTPSRSVWLQSNRIPSFVTLIGVFMISGLAPVQAANVLVVAGTTLLAQTAGTVLSGELTSAGNTVTVVNTGVPASLAGYTQIYDVRYDNSPAFTAGEMTQYLAFLNAAPNNTIFMMGENISFNARNTPILQFITLAGGGTIATPASTSTASETVASQFTAPNSISTVKFAACGLVTSAGTGAFASSESGGGCSIFFGLGALQNATQGALVVVFDVNFIANAPNGGAVNEVFFRKNLEAFVSSPPVAPPPPAPPSAPTPAGAPTLSEWGMALLAGGLIFVAARKLRAPVVANRK